MDIRQVYPPTPTNIIKGVLLAEGENLCLYFQYLRPKDILNYGS